MSAFVPVILHGAVGIFDEILLFGGLTLLILGLLVFPRAMRFYRNRRAGKDEGSG